MQIPDELAEKYVNVTVDRYIIEENRQTALRSIRFRQAAHARLRRYTEGDVLITRRGIGR